MKQSARNPEEPLRIFMTTMIAVLVAIGLGGPLQARDRDQDRTPSSQESVSRPAVPRGSASSNQSAGSSRMPTAKDTRQVAPAGYRRPSSSARGPSSPHVYIRHGGFHFGYHYPYYRPFYWYWGWWGPYWYPSAYWAYPVPAYGARYVGSELGGLDLNVKPKKASVYVDGQYVGQVKHFDGYPGYLWLERGAYQVSFSMPGYKTVTHSLEIRPGQVFDVRFRMEPGTSVPVEEQVNSVAPSSTAPPSPQTPGARQEAAEERAPAPRGEAGRLVLSIAPSDASVYLDGRFLGSGFELGRLHAGLLVEAGRHKVEVVRPGYEPQSRDIFIEPDGELEVKVDLTVM